jgi:phenylalanyl-tRNA synthetase beta chain
MKFSEQWLREWVNPDIDTQSLADMLTMAGLEVDAIEPVAGDFDQTVVGQVIALSSHPDADKLNVCQVDVGQGEPLQIVCGASNVAMQMKAPVALIGATLPGGLKIKKAKLRGVESNGMLCSAKELGLAEASEGLLALPVDAPVGMDIRQYLKLDDRTLELGLTPNRGDCLSIAGIAREVAVLSRCNVNVSALTAVTPGIQKTFPVAVDVPEDCPRYVGRVIEGVNTGAATPVWMKEALRRSGLRSLGPVVDVTNYVLLELGQPMHAFDLAKLVGGLRVRHAAEGEKIVLLDGQTIALEAGTLVIADDKGPQALAGIMGGAGSAVSGTTETIFLESAFFRPLSVAGRARRYGLHTDSSHRFERGVDPQLQAKAIERATQLLIDIAGGQAGPIVEVVSEKDLPGRSEISLRRSRVEKVLGATIPDTQITDILQRLGAAVRMTSEGWAITPPSFRFDMEIEIDLIEEIARVYGYANLPSSHPQSGMNMLPVEEGRVGLSLIKQMLTDRGYQEAITYSFVEPGLQSLLEPTVKPIRLANPISEEMSVMRTSLWAGLIQTLIHNLNRQQNDVRLFESGLKFIGQHNEVKQESSLAGLVSGAVYPEQWGEKSRPVDFYDLKGDVEALLEKAANTGNVTFVPDSSHSALHPGQAARIYLRSQSIGWIGALHPVIEQKLDLAQQVYVFELSLTCFENARTPKFEPISRFPSVRRDLAVIVGEAVTASALEELIWRHAGKQLKNFQLFDVYKGKGIDSGRKSVAFGLTFQDQSRTLEDTDIEAALTPILSALAAELGATLRE